MLLAQERGLDEVKPLPSRKVHIVVLVKERWIVIAVVLADFHIVVYESVFHFGEN